MSSKNINKITRIKKIFIILIFIFLSLILLLSNVFVTITDKRRLPNLESSKTELAIRGNILSEDNFKIASSLKLYKATIDTRFLDIKKIDLFVKLFSIYSDIPEAKIYEKISNSLKNPGSIVLSYNIDSKTAKNLKELGFKLRHLNVFKSIEINDNKILRGLNINESGEKRLYSYDDTLTPVIGYIRKYESDNGKTKVNGIKGLEKSYNNILNNTKDGKLEGTRDVLSYISFNKNSIVQNRVDGADLILNIPLRLQKNLELMIDQYKTKLSADEIIVSVMESDTGKIKALASSNRFNPGLIRQTDIPYLDVSAIEFLFEPGSIIKPVSISLVMDKNRIKKDELFNAYNNGKLNSKGEYPRGKYKLGRYIIGDDHEFTKHYLTVDDIFIYSSNIGTLQLAQRLSGKEMYEGLKSFGITEKTQIDLPYEKVGVMPSVRQFSAGEDKGEDNVFKATISYGQGMTGTFMQMIKAYSAFNNNGIIVTPKIVQSLSVNDKKVSLADDTQKRVISKKTANEIKRLLIKTITKGTGVNAQIEGIEVGGKTGTAQIARHGKYQNIYISSFFGFANDKNKKYTIGVTVINPISTGRYWYYHYASWSAVPVFKEVVNNLIKLNYLTKSTDN
ncbi:penicillin-binding protein 2 [Arcobacter sp. F2176]|uniref:peptidoglycan D,D-transpeptidase FtsI family protein n=1 Tax=unclassified Arcobacter TaxID=2593671 RepID=UPI00100B55F9|nr:penicillin-binding protein 2 [Arcobacter sp. F2176]RXJ80278.1 cell division protein FtsW [Arcobacter sp. F2176]